MELDIIVTIGLGFIISFVTLGLLISGNAYWKNRDPFDGDLKPEEKN
jgi:hypothetical protein